MRSRAVFETNYVKAKQGVLGINVKRLGGELKASGTPNKNKNVPRGLLEAEPR